MLTTFATRPIGDVRRAPLPLSFTLDAEFRVVHERNELHRVGQSVTKHFVLLFEASRCLYPWPTP